MEIKPIKVVRSTKKAWMIQWFDYNFKGIVQAWVPKSKVKIEHQTAYMELFTYNNLKIIQNVKRKKPKDNQRDS